MAQVQPDHLIDKKPILKTERYDFFLHFVIKVFNLRVITLPACKNGRMQYIYLVNKSGWQRSKCGEVSLFSLTSTFSTKQNKLMSQFILNLHVMCQLLKSNEKLFLAQDPELELSYLIKQICSRRKHSLSMFQGTSVCPGAFPS